MSIRAIERNKLCFSLTKKKNCRLYSHFNNFPRAIQLKKWLADPFKRSNWLCGHNFVLRAHITAWMHEWSPRTFHRSNERSLAFRENALKQWILFGTERRLVTPLWYDCQNCVSFTHRCHWIDRQKWLTLLMTSSLKHRRANTVSAT
jgi:hypothetical protein